MLKLLLIVSVYLVRINRIVPFIWLTLFFSPSFSGLLLPVSQDQTTENFGFWLGFMRDCKMWGRQRQGHQLLSLLGEHLFQAFRSIGDSPSLTGPSTHPAGLLLALAPGFQLHPLLPLSIRYYQLSVVSVLWAASSSWSFLFRSSSNFIFPC